MKTKPTLLCASACLLLSLTTVDQAQGFEVTYNYIGSPYTQTTAPNQPGFTLSDFVVASITLDSIFWGTTVNGGSGTINSGPWQVGTDAFHVTTDLTGTIVAWNLSGASPGLDIATGGNPDGSGLDNIFGDRPGATGAASVEYAAGPRPPGTGWTMVVPEPSTFALLIVAMIGAGAWICRPMVSKTSAGSPGHE